jgi:hypothetical protein
MNADMFYSRRYLNKIIYLFTIMLGAAENWTHFASKVDSKTFQRKGE